MYITQTVTSKPSKCVDNFRIYHTASTCLKIDKPYMGYMSTMNKAEYSFVKNSPIYDHSQ